MTSPASTDPAQHYARRVIQAYLRLPHTPARARDQDRLLAAQLHQRGVSFTIVEAAFLLATLRRIHRPPDAEPLNPIHSLHYFLPVIEELRQRPPSASYLRYLRRSLATITSTHPADDGQEKDAFT